VRETFEEKGWEYGLDGRFDNEALPLLAESGDLRVVFYARDPGTGECWFELRGEAWCTCGARRTYRRRREPGRCSRATAPLCERWALLTSACFTSYRSRRC